MDYVEQKIVSFKKAVESQNFDDAATILLEDLLLHDFFKISPEILNCVLLARKRIVSEILNYVFMSGEVSSLKRVVSEKKYEYS